eukprot:3136982-Amphidinium_carterae.1
MMLNEADSIGSSGSPRWETDGGGARRGQAAGPAVGLAWRERGLDGGGLRVLRWPVGGENWLAACCGVEDGHVGVE